MVLNLPTLGRTMAKIGSHTFYTGLLPASYCSAVLWQQYLV